MDGLLIACFKLSKFIYLKSRKYFAKDEIKRISVFNLNLKTLKVVLSICENTEINIFQCLQLKPLNREKNEIKEII